MAEKTRQQWIRAVRRWTLLGAVLGLLVGVVGGIRDDAESVLAYVAFCVPAGAAFVVMLWASTYRYDLAKVWGKGLALLTVATLVGLIALTVGVGCLQGICDGGRP